MTTATTDLADLVDRARTLDAHSVARLVSIFQDRRPQARATRAAAIDLLDDGGPGAVVLGVTGTPGSGKSTLLGRIAVDLLRERDDLSVAILAVDPSSHISGGALLGDRTRLRIGSTDRRLYFRSEASDTELGGLSPSSFQVCRLLTRLFDCVVIETVGIGQSEGDVRHLADSVLLIVAPLGGDEVQFLKAGIIEVPDAFVVNKCDEPTAGRTYRQLRASLWLARPFDADDLPVYQVSAKTGVGVDELRAALTEQIDAGPTSDRMLREAHFLERWVRDEWGRVGVVRLRSEHGGARELLAASDGYDDAQERFAAGA